jgi:hypothetical protein
MEILSALAANFATPINTDWQLEAMDLLVDPIRQRVTVNPAHPNYPVALAK